MTPAPIPLRWSLSAVDMAGPVAAAVGAPDTPPGFQPLPGHTAITEADLRAGGGRRELHHLYSGLASGRVVVVGAPGAGKSGAAILLLLDALEHRDQLDDAAQTRCPVPVLFTAHGWNPVTCSVRDWLAARLAAAYPLFGRHNGPAEAATLLDARDKVALILDGLDEMDQALRLAALQALSDAPFRVIVLTRSPELIQATTRGWLVGAVAMRLRDVTAPDAAGYLQRARIGPAPSGWPDLLTHLHEHPDGVLARGVANPLALTLLRDTYQAGDDVSELLHTRYRSPEAIEQHLITRILPAAYTPRAGRPPPRYSLPQAHQTLTFLARRMNQDHTRDLAWWNIPHYWAPTTPRVLATGVLGGLPVVVILGPALGLKGGLESGLVEWLTAWLLVGFAVGLTGRGKDEPRWAKVENWRAALSRGNWRAVPSRQILGRILTGRRIGLVRDGVDEANSLGPWEIWRHDRIFFPLPFSLAGGLRIKLTVSQTWPTTLAWLQLWISGHVPAVRLMPFLEDARERGVLRTVGTVYQFRHATLQDQLADQASPSSPATSTVPHTP